MAYDEKSETPMKCCRAYQKSTRFVAHVIKKMYLWE